MNDERIAEVLRQLRDGTWRMPPTQQFSKDFLRKIAPGRERHSWRHPEASTDHNGDKRAA